MEDLKLKNLKLILSYIKILEGKINPKISIIIVSLVLQKQLKLLLNLFFLNLARILGTF